MCVAQARVRIVTNEWKTQRARVALISRRRSAATSISRFHDNDCEKESFVFEIFSGDVNSRA